MGTVRLRQHSSGCYLFLLIGERIYYSGQCPEDGQGLIHEKGTFLLETGTTVTIQEQQTTSCELILKNGDDLGEVGHDGFFIGEGERCHAAQMKMVTHCCLCTEGQHVSSGRRDRLSI